MSESHELRCSLRLCGRICRRGKSSFLTSFALLDRPRRQAMCALYAFARIVDDLADSQAPRETRGEKLECYRQQLWRHAAMDAEGYRGTTTTIWPALRDCVRRYRIPPQLLDELITGVATDLQPRQPTDWLELEHYCYQVASTVGLACTHVWRADNQRPTLAPPLRQSAIDCGVAFQLTNILRDIAEDARDGRIYLPQELFDDYRVDSTHWLAGRPSGDWEEMLDDVAHRAGRLYIAGWTTIEALSPHSQRMFSLMWRSYRSLLERIVSEKSQLWCPRRVRLPKVERLQLVTSHFVSPIYARLGPP